MDDLPSRTAMGSAVLPAAHVHEDAPPWLLEDRLSEQPLDSRSLAEVRAEIAQWSPDVRAYTRSEVAGLLGGVGFSSVTLLDAAALKGRTFPTAVICGCRIRRLCASPGGKRTGSR